MESEESQGFLAYDCRSHGIADVFSEPQHAVEPSHEEPYDLIAFLATCQKLRVDFVPLRWLVALGTIGTGGEARVNQSLMNRSTDLAFRRVKLDAHSREEQIHMYRSLIFQLDILCGVGTKVHPNIIDMIAVSWEISPGIPAQCQGSSTPGDSQILPVLIFERARHGNLYRFMTEGAGKSFGSVAKIKLCLDIISGIENLHDKCTIHGDIKPENILVFEERPGIYIAKISDFGGSRKLLMADSLAKVPRSIPWEAPEWHPRWHELDTLRKMDLYSFALVCLWICFEEQLPVVGIYVAPNSTRVYDLQQLKKGYRLREISIQLLYDTSNFKIDQRTVLKNLFLTCLAHDPAERVLSAGQIAESLRQAIGANPKIVSTEVDSTHVPLAIGDDVMLKKEGFELARSLMAFYSDDFRLRRFIATCLQDRQPLALHSTDDTRADLSLCYWLGFGVPCDLPIAASLLNRSDANTFLEALVQDIKQYNHVEFYHHPYLRQLAREDVIGSIDFYHYYLERGLLAEAEREHRREIADASAVLGDSHMIVMQLETILCHIVKHQGNLEEVVELEQQIVKKCRRALGSDHISTLFSMCNLCNTYVTMEKWDMAEDLARQLVTKRGCKYGGDHPLTLNSKGDLATILAGKGHLREAERNFKQILKSSVKTKGADHPATLAFAANITSVLLEQEEWAEAEELERVVLTRTTHVLGPRHPDVIISKSNLAQAIGGRGHWLEAERIHREAISLSTAVLGQTHFSTLVCKDNLAGMLRDKGSIQEAQALEAEVHEAREQTLHETLHV